MAQANVAPAVAASTIVLVRDAPAGVEVLMVVRHHQIDFASGALVFPGGKVDAQDESTASLARAGTGAINSAQTALRVAAIREAYEESGILLARHAASGAELDAAELARLEPQRRLVHDGKLPFADMLRIESMELAVDELAHFAHWITPEMMPRRFDTHFYVARVPPDQIAAHDGRESVDSVWLTAASAIEDAQQKRRTVIFPTLRNLEKLARFRTVDELIQVTRRTPVVPVLPWTEQRADGRYLCITPAAGYDISEERMGNEA